MCNTLTSEESLSYGIPVLLRYAENNPANRLPSEVKARKAVQATMMKGKAFKWTLYHIVKATESVFVLKVPRRGKGNASDKRVRSCGVWERQGIGIP